MIYILLPIIILILVLLIKKWKTIFQKIKLFFKNYKFIVVLEIILIIIMIIINIYNKTIVIKEKNPHTNKALKSTVLKEGEQYECYVMKFISKSNIQEKANYLLIKEVGMSKLTIEKDGEEIEYNYGKGFSYYGTNSCNCGTPIIFYKRTYGILKILSLSIIVIDLIIICLVKENKPKGEV